MVTNSDLMPGIACQAQGCTFNTTDQVAGATEVSDQILILRIHTDVITHLVAKVEMDKGHVKVEVGNLMN